MSQQHTVIIIAGPTAVGKTAVGIAVAKQLGTEIISADSRQCYRELNIGVARPSPDELAQVPHHFIASHSIFDKVTAATFERYALAKTEELFRQHQTVVMVGGTGLYIKAFSEGMDPIPEIPEAVHNEVVEAFNKQGLPLLQDQIKSLDPLFFNKGEIQNPQRLMRALEVVKSTGKSILAFQTGEKKKRPFSIRKIVLELPRAELYQRINHRVDEMMAAGLLEEVKSLLPYRHLNALQTVGYRELVDHLDGRISLTTAVESIKQHTRHYAKRQLTWFRKHGDYTPLPPDAGAVLSLLDKTNKSIT